ncbi:hypothetical protein GT360_14640 [Vibrio astriarenae]|uniref:Uncharacterized protein n=1 Tax=Vibrio astriarenae TaxID=1481923 RepID=A0A7Z2YET9_9VIBR|nr:hypothetical protein [Vibrio astriarenae]QIA64802.1 hypothetical protein GT360_14640 [Vibrio astriarenae]
MTMRKARLFDASGFLSDFTYQSVFIMKKNYDMIQWHVSQILFNTTHTSEF